MSRKQESGVTDPRWRSSIEPAPGDLRIVQAWVNTSGIGGVDEALRNVEELAEWLMHWDLLNSGSVVGAADLELALEVRSAFRSWIGRGAETALDPEVGVTLNRASVAAPLRVRVNREGVAVFEPIANGFARGLARLFEIIALAQRDQRWYRLKLCQQESCGLAFYDFSSGLNAKWCSRRCGDRESSRRYRGRRRRHRERTRRLRLAAS